MKFNSAFKLSALALALATTTSAFAATLNTSVTDNDLWLDPRGEVLGDVDDADYQYVDVGSKNTTNPGSEEPNGQNKLTELYKLDGDKNFYLKVSPIGSSSEQNATIYTFHDEKLSVQVLAALNSGPTQYTSLENVSAEQIAELFKTNGNNVAGELLAYVQANGAFQFEDLEVADSTVQIPTDATLIMAGTSRDSIKTDEETSDVKRVDTYKLEYADSTVQKVTLGSNVGNLTNDDKSSVVLGNVNDINPIEIETLRSDRGVKTGILNESISSSVSTTDREYGVFVHSTQTERDITDLSDIKETTTEKSTKITENAIYIKSSTEKTGEVPVVSETKITAEGIKTDGKIEAATLSVGGKDLGKELEKVNKASEDLSTKIDDVKIDLNQRAAQLNTRISDVEKTAYRGVAIALAAQQQVPNIKPGQFAVFGGVGHYEGESAVAFGLVGALNERTSLSAALGTAGSEVGGRVGVSYVFGGGK